jgi:hypothetical protein
MRGPLAHPGVWPGAASASRCVSARQAADQPAAQAFAAPLKPQSFLRPRIARSCPGQDDAAGRRLCVKLVREERNAPLERASHRHARAEADGPRRQPVRSQLDDCRRLCSRAGVRPLMGKPGVQVSWKCARGCCPQGATRRPHQRRSPSSLWGPLPPHPGLVHPTCRYPCPPRNCW